MRNFSLYLKMFSGIQFKIPWGRILQLQKFEKIFRFCKYLHLVNLFIQFERQYIQ